MQLMSIASGSSGNCIYVGDENTHILIDAGISKKRIEEGLHTIGLTLDDLSAVFVTHEHIDHIGGLGVLTRKCHAPVYATRGTIDGIFQTASLGKIDREQFFEIEENQCLTIGGIQVDAMKIFHDAAQPVAYRFLKDGKKIAVATDLGTVTEENEEKLKGMNAILLEANHDVNMLQVGPYPYYLKKRILGNKGHLSNENAGRLLSRIVHDELKYIFLGHLSKDNNMPELAYETVRLEITMGNNPYDASDFFIDIAKRGAPTKAVTI